MEKYGEIWSIFTNRTHGVPPVRYERASGGRSLFAAHKVIYVVVLLQFPKSQFSLNLIIRRQSDQSKLRSSL